MTIYLSLAFALAGLLMYILAQSGKVQELGRICFACGILAFLLRVTNDVSFLR